MFYFRKPLVRNQFLFWQSAYWLKFCFADVYHEKKEMFEREAGQ